MPDNNFELIIFSRSFLIRRKALIILELKVLRVMFLVYKIVFEADSWGFFCFHLLNRGLQKHVPTRVLCVFHVSNVCVGMCTKTSIKQTWAGVLKREVQQAPTLLVLL